MVMVDVVGVKFLADFEVIEIVEDMGPYLVLLGIDQAIDVRGVINLKKHSMVFEKNGTCVIVPLDPTEGACYTEPTYEDEELDHIYRMIAQEEDQDDPPKGRVFSQEKNRE